MARPSFFPAPDRSLPRQLNDFYAGKLTHAGEVQFLKQYVEQRREWDAMGAVAHDLPRGLLTQWSHPNLAIDQLVAPLGLTGPYVVWAIHHYREHERRNLETVTRDHQFDINLTPAMTLLHIVAIASSEDWHINGETGCYAETIRIRPDHVIEIGLRSS